jgi:hypothetical protein
MDEVSPSSRVSILGLVLYPGLVTLAVTLLRLVGELEHGPKLFFNTEVGGPWSIVGITWLGPIFGIYFALKLSARSEIRPSAWRLLGFALLGVTVMVGSTLLAVHLSFNRTFQGRLIYFWLAYVLAALVTFPGWPSLFKTLLAYAYAARLPVAILMFFAFRGNWGTHYDAPPPDLPAGMGLWPKYLWLGFFPQLTFWVGFTIVAGMLFGALAAAFLFRGSTAQQAIS